jgi:hypothetical protein
MLNVGSQLTRKDSSVWSRTDRPLIFIKAENVVLKLDSYQVHIVKNLPVCQQRSFQYVGCSEKLSSLS